MKTGILGAGSIGCYIGGMLALASHQPVLVGRPSMQGRLSGGITLSRHDGLMQTAGPESYSFSTSPEQLADCDAVLVCVKSPATEDAARILAPLLRDDAIVVSLQNGISNARVLRGAITKNPVLAGMVGFNVAQIGDDRFHCGTDGDITMEDHPRTRQLAALLTAAGVPARTEGDIESVLWGKLLLNLNNPVNALSGLPLKRQLSRRRYRRVTAAAVREALAAMKAAGISPAKIGKAPPGLMARVLELPDFLFTRIAASMLRIDDDARSSMAEDLERGRRPEIEWLNGEIVALGRANGVPTPVNEKLVALIEAAFEAKHPAAMSGEALLRETGLTS